MKEARQKRVHTVWLHLCTTLEIESCIYRDRRQVCGHLGWAWGEKWITGARRSLWRDRYVHYLDCGNSEVSQV